MYFLVERKSYNTYNANTRRFKAHKVSCCHRFTNFQTDSQYQLKNNHQMYGIPRMQSTFVLPPFPDVWINKWKQTTARVSRGSRTRKRGEGTGRVTSRREQKHLQPPLATITLPCCGTDRTARTTDGTNDAKQKRSSRRGPLRSHREWLGSLNDGTWGPARGWVWSFVSPPKRQSRMSWAECSKLKKLACGSVKI